MSPVNGNSLLSWRAWFKALCLRRLTLAMAITSIVVPIACHAQEKPTEYEIKAAFVFNFLKFTQWPDKVFANANSPLRICTTSPDPFGAALDTITDKQIGAHGLQIDREVPAKTLRDCDAVFIGTEEATEAASIARRLQDRPILTISEAQGFARAGGMIGLTVVDGQVRFEVNPTAAGRAGLTMSSQLLKLAIIVEDAQ